MNVWTFTGRIGKDCETRFTPKGDAVTSFSVAVTSGYGEKETTTWARLSMFGKRGEAVAPYLLKGTQIAVSGELTNREYTDKDGNKRQSLEVRVNDLTLLGGKNDGARETGSGQSIGKAQQPGGDFSDMDSDIPF